MPSMCGQPPKKTDPGKNLDQGIERLKEAAGQGMVSRQ